MGKNLTDEFTINKEKITNILNRPDWQDLITKAWQAETNNAASRDFMNNPPLHLQTGEPIKTTQIINRYAAAARYIRSIRSDYQQATLEKVLSIAKSLRK